MASARTIRSLLVANRGEIALRVIRAARELGIRTIAVFAEDDAGALHVEEADDARLLPGESPRATYLDPEAILAAARDAGADAIHPGYGFLSERESFARAVERAGLGLIGPSADALAAVGAQTHAKRIAEAAGVPTIPWTDASDLTPAQLRAAAARIGYPILIKATAGGGGRGMRVVGGESALEEAAAVARAEAAGAFGDGAIFLEKLLAGPRHVEVQILADGTGAVRHLFERECSIQRRHQKILEEAPSVAVDAASRARLAEAAIAIARATGYTNAGTVEFLIDAAGASYLMEVNARLEVEHPVTEAIAGLDLVAWQIRIARGEPIAFTQESLAPRGHAIECRLTAEDPLNGFLPSGGVIRRLALPAGPGIRVDRGVREGDTVSTRYDSLLAKIVVHGEDRDAAIRRMARALRETIVLGLPTNLPFLQALLAHEAFRRGDTTIDFLERHGGALTRADEAVRGDVIAAALYEALRSRVAGLGGGAGGASGSEGTLDAWDLLRNFRCGA